MDRCFRIFRSHCIVWSDAHADADTGFYAGAAVGRFSVEIDQTDFAADDAAVKLFGGWRFSPSLAVEVAYLDLGAPEDAIGVPSIPEDPVFVDVATDITGFAPYLVTAMQLGRVELFAKLGYFLYDAEVSAEGLGADSDSDEGFIYAVGLGAVLVEQLAVRFECEKTDIAHLDAATAYWLSAAWRF